MTQTNDTKQISKPSQTSKTNNPPKKQAQETTKTSNQNLQAQQTT